MDGDGDLDFSDFAAFNAALFGPGVPSGAVELRSDGQHNDCDDPIDCDDPDCPNENRCNFVVGLRRTY